MRKIQSNFALILEMSCGGAFPETVKVALKLFEDPKTDFILSEFLDDVRWCLDSINDLLKEMICKYDCS